MSNTSFDDWATTLDAQAVSEAVAGDDTKQRLAAAFSAHYQDEADRSFAVPSQLVAARKACGLTQAELAKITGVDQAAISRIERGQINASLDTVSRLSKPLGLHLALVDSSGHLA